MFFIPVPLEFFRCVFGRLLLFEGKRERNSRQIKNRPYHIISQRGKLKLKSNE